MQYKLTEDAIREATHLRFSTSPHPLPDPYALLIRLLTFYSYCFVWPLFSTCTLTSPISIPFPYQFYLLLLSLSYSTYVFSLSFTGFCSISPNTPLIRTLLSFLCSFTPLYFHANFPLPHFFSPLVLPSSFKLTLTSLRLIPAQHPTVIHKGEASTSGSLPNVSLLSKFSFISVLSWPT